MLRKRRDKAAESHGLCQVPVTCLFPIVDFFYFVPARNSKSISLSPPSLFPLGSVWQGHDHLHIVAREIALQAAQRSLIPVLIDLVDQCDDVTLVEAQLALILRIKVIQSLTAWLVCRYKYQCKDTKLRDLMD